MLTGGIRQAYATGTEALAGNPAVKEIACDLNLSVKTVETHRVNIKTRLQIGSVQELIAYAARWAGTQEAGAT